MTMKMMTKASEVQLKIINIKLLHLNHQLLNQRIKLKFNINTQDPQNAKTRQQYKPFSTHQIERTIEPIPREAKLQNKFQR